MAELRISIPCGKFCSDKGKLDCLHNRHEGGASICGIFDKGLEKAEIYLDDGSGQPDPLSRMRVIKKCSECLAAMTNSRQEQEYGKVAKEVSGWQFK